MFEEAQDDPSALIIINIEAVRIHSKLAPYGSVRLRRCAECGGSESEEQNAIDPLGAAVKPSRCEVHLKELNHISFKTVIVDEAHRMKDPSSKQTRACWAVGHQDTVTRRYALTGTPISQDMGDLWSIMHFIAPHEHPTRGGWVERFCLLGWGAEGQLEILGIRPDTREEFFRIIDPRTRRMPKALVLPQLPPKIYERRVVELTTKQRKAYKELEDHLVTRLEDGRRVVTTNSLTNQIRLTQLASSYFEVIEEPGSNGEVKRGIRMCDPSPKLDDMMLLDRGDLLGKQYVVCAVSRQLIEMAAGRLEKFYGPDQVVQVTGAIQPGIRQANLAAFQQGRAKVLLFTIQAGGTGLNMTAADTMIRLQRSCASTGSGQTSTRASSSSTSWPTTRSRSTRRCDST
jgi:SNF2 family DNA or RNA helicase